MSESAKRRLDMLKSALGSITPWLEKDTITEIMLNPDGKVWVNEHEDCIHLVSEICLS